MASEQYTPEQIRNMSKDDKAELADRAKTETVVEGGTGGNSLEAQLHLKEGRNKGGRARAQQMGHEGYQEMGKKGGLASNGASADERMENEGIEVDESKFTK